MRPKHTNAGVLSSEFRIQACQDVGGEPAGTGKPGADDKDMFNDFEIG